MAVRRRTSTARSRAGPTAPPQRAARALLLDGPVPDRRLRDRHALRRHDRACRSRARTCTSSTTRRSARRCSRGCWRGTRDFHFLYVDVAGHGLLPVEAERQGKVVVTTELGGGGRVPRAGARARLRAGSTNVLRHVGRARGRGRDARLAGPAGRVDPRRPRPAQLRLRAEVGDLRDAGRRRRAGRRPAQPVGRLYSLEHPEREPETIEAPLDGVVVAIRAISWTEQGDNVFALGQPIEAAALL